MFLQLTLAIKPGSRPFHRSTFSEWLELSGITVAKLGCAGKSLCPELHYRWAGIDCFDVALHRKWGIGAQVMAVGTLERDEHDQPIILTLWTTGFWWFLGATHVEYSQLFLWKLCRIMGMGQHLFYKGIFLFEHVLSVFCKGSTLSHPISLLLV